jgi:hypothetical protein
MFQPRQQLKKITPTACQLLMRLEKKDMQGVKIFTDVSINWNYIATVTEAWKDKGHFVAANAAAYLHRIFLDVGLSFFPSHVGTQVKAQGWNEEEDHPVIAGEEELNYVLKCYADNLAMNKMFDFSKMDNTPLKKDLYWEGGCPDKSSQVEAPTSPQKLAHQEALSLADQSEYYNKDGTP